MNVKSKEPVQSEPKSTAAVAWLLFVAAIMMPLVAWIQAQAGNSAINAYTVFPLLGLWAWSIMWTHYGYGTLTIISSRFQKNHLYNRLSGYLVLGLILLHPGLLAWQRWLNTGQLPPASYIDYIGESGKLYLLIAGVALASFLIYDVLVRLRQQKVVSRYWFWISITQMSAMILIFMHSLALGQHLQHGWFQYYWTGLGLLLIPCFAVIGYRDYKLGRTSTGV